MPKEARRNAARAFLTRDRCPFRVPSSFRFALKLDGATDCFMPGEVLEPPDRLRPCNLTHEASNDQLIRSKRNQMSA